jgi:hypothetical protein
MSDEVLVIRFPNGDAEIYSGSFVPSTGDRLTRRESEWIVARVDTRGEGRTTVIVMPVVVRRDESWPKPYEFVRMSNPAAWL